MYILIKQFSDKFNRLYTKSMNENEIVEVYEEYKKSKNNKLSIFCNRSC